MRTAGLTFLTSIFFLILFVYLTNSISPWNQTAVSEAIDVYDINSGENFTVFIDEVLELGLIWELISIKNLVIWISVLGGAFVSMFISIHMIIDKLFFRKFFEEPDFWMAFRRGFLIYLAFSSLLILRLIAGLVWYNALAVVILGAAIEMGFVYYHSHKKEKQSEVLPEKENRFISNIDD